MTNPSPRPALRKAEDAAVHPAAPRPARAVRAPKPPTPTTEKVAAVRPRTIADTNRDADAAAAARATKHKGRAAAPAPRTSPAKAVRKKHKFSGSTSDHLRVPDTEFVEHPKPKGDRRGAAKPTAKAKPPATAMAKSKGTQGSDLMSGKVVDLGARVPKKLRAAAKAEAKRRGLDLDAVTSELLYTWLDHSD
jgi:hypothetical protein